MEKEGNNLVVQTSISHYIAICFPWKNSRLPRLTQRAKAHCTVTVQLLTHPGGSYGKPATGREE